jgi:hypothetical protein
MLQLTRHGFVKPRDGRSVPFVVPVVKAPRLPVARVLAYKASKATEAGAVTPELVDYATAARTKQLEHQALEFAADGKSTVHFEDDADHEPPSPTRLKRRTSKKPAPEGQGRTEG